MHTLENQGDNTPMRSILKELAHDNITTVSRACWQDPAYKKSVQVGARLEEKLLATLNEEEKELLEKYKDETMYQCCVEGNDRFIHGFKLGLTLTAEAFVTSGDLITG